MHGDEEGEGDAVREHARREEEAAAEEDLALEDPGLLADQQEETQPEGLLYPTRLPSMSEKITA